MSVPSRILDNQRRAVLALIAGLERRLTPGRPFLVDLRHEFSGYKGFGSRDRRLYRELLFTWLRFRPWFDDVRKTDAPAAVDLLVALAPDADELMALQSSIALPGGLSKRPWPEMKTRLEELCRGRTFELRALLPAWFEPHCPDLFRDDEILTQIRRPPFWLRAQRGTAAELVREFVQTGVTASVESAIPGAARVADYVDLEAHALIVSGKAEIQDIGSQALLAMAAPERGSSWMDFCAGAGGKTLQLAAMIGPDGKVKAHDVRREALVETKRRVTRAGLKNVIIEPVLPEPGTIAFDGVLVDAPCSASGTWRRHPFLRHQTTPAVINRYVPEQLALLERASVFVRHGGRLLYATCSLSRHENDGVLAAFLRKHRDFALEPPANNRGYVPAPSGAVTLMPSVLDSDGYFLACMRRVR